MKRENNKGITLIALAITIGVLIIISFISIASLTSDNGIIKQTNVAKVEKIEGDAREQVGIGLTTMNLAILEARGRDNSYSAIANSGKIKSKLIENLNADKTGLDGEFTNAGIDEGDNATEIKIAYIGDDYKTACNDTNAHIVYTLTLNQRAIELKGEINVTLKDQNKNDVIIDVGGNIDEKVEPISKTDSYVGCYANLDSDPEPEGIIYADLAIKTSGEWGTSDTNKAYGAFSYGPVTGTKDYYISEEDYAGTFGIDEEDKKRDIITVAPGSTGEDRFYVMALKDFKTVDYKIFYWYNSANTNKISDYSTKTSTDFGTGKANTEAMIAAWNIPSYGAQNAKDMWGVVQEKVNEGWFVPSRGEWGAFGNSFGITSSNFSSYGLSAYCWSSSLGYFNYAWRANFVTGEMYNTTLSDSNYVRLGATF